MIQTHGPLALPLMRHFLPVLLLALTALTLWPAHAQEVAKPGSAAAVGGQIEWRSLSTAQRTALAPLLGGAWKPMVALSLLLAVWIVLTAVLNVVQRVQATRAGGSFGAALGRQPRSFFGMHLAHVGIAVFVVGVALVNGYQTEKDVKMAPGDTVSVGGYSFRFNGVNAQRGPNYQALVGDVDLLRDGRVLRQLKPEKRNYFASSMPMTEAAIDSGLLRDVYVSLGEPIDRARPDGEWAVRVYHKPLVGWIWGGCLIMALGGLLAASDRRYRLPARRSAADSTAFEVSA